MAKRSWQGLVIHHTASPGGFWSKKDYRAIDVEEVRRWHKNKGWSDIGYHYLILADGRIEAGRSTERDGAHTRASGRNRSHLGVALVGNFEQDVPSPEQMESLLVLSGRLKKEYGFGNVKIELHREVQGAATKCPGKLFPKEYFFQKLGG